MELFKYLNNEALDEDQKAKREVIERIYKNAKQVDENVVAKEYLSKEDINLLIKYILNLNASIDEVFFNVAEAKGKEVLNLGEIPYKYNLLANYIKNLGYVNMDSVDKSIINEKVYKLIPKLTSLENIAYEDNFIDKFLVPTIIENIKNKTYNTLYDEPEINREIKQLKKAGRPKKVTTKEDEIIDLEAELRVLEKKKTPKSKKDKAKLELKIEKLKEKITKMKEEPEEEPEEETNLRDEVEAEEPKEGFEEEIVLPSSLTKEQKVKREEILKNWRKLTGEEE